MKRASSPRKRNGSGWVKVPLTAAQLSDIVAENPDIFITDAKPVCGSIHADRRGTFKRATLVFDDGWQTTIYATKGGESIRHARRFDLVVSPKEARP